MLAFSMIWRRGILRIYLEEEVLIKYCVIKHLILLETHVVVNANACLLQWVIICLTKKTSGSGVNSQIMTNEGLAEEIHIPIIRKCEKRKLYSSFKGIILTFAIRY